MWDAINRVQAVIEFDLSGNIIDVNDNFLKVMGYSRAEVVGRHHRMFCEDRYANSLAYRELWTGLAAGEFKAGEFKRLCKDGRDVWIEASYNPVFDAKKRVKSVVKFATDITIKKQQQAENNGRIIAIDRAMGVIEFDLTGHVLSANKNFLAVLGYGIEEIAGKHHRIFVDKDYASSRDYRDFWEKLARGELDGGEYKRYGKNGREIWIQATYNPILNADGQPVKIVKFASDITEQKVKGLDTTSKLKAIDRAMGVIEFSLDGRVLTANSNFLNIIGYDLEEVVGKHHRTVCDPEYVSSIEYQKFWDRLNRGEFDAGRYRRIAKGGREIWIQATYNPVFDASGTLIKVVKFATDITRQVQNELAMRDEATHMAHSIDQLTEAVVAISKQSTELSATTEQSAADGRAAMEKSIEAMADIEKANNEISAFITAIQEIATKTSLLALNATIEASRAGEHGKGFAVVATEVNTLAARSASASSEITKAILSAVKRVEEGSEISREASEIFDRVITTIKQSTSRICEINQTADQAACNASVSTEKIRHVLGA